MKRSMALFFAMVLSIIVVSCQQTNENDGVGETTSPPTVAVEPILLPPSKQESMLLTYLKDEQVGQYGIYTNRLDSEQADQVATGHEVLSESAGLMMAFFAKKKDQIAFQQEWELARQVFDQETGFSYRYSPKLVKRYSVNAAVDDLRIVKALYEGAKVFEDSSYMKQANKYASRFIAHNIVNAKLYDFHDEQYKMVNSYVTLCYIDLETLLKFPLTDKESRKLQANMTAVIEGGYLSDQFPFYETRFHYDKNNYSSEDINMVEGMLTVLSLAEVGKHKQASIHYIKEHVKAGTLYGKYTKSGERITDVRSTALFALAAMIGKTVKDEELYRDSLAWMLKFQILDTASPLYGGFGDPVSGQAYSFDNLMALNALALQQK